MFHRAFVFTFYFTICILHLASTACGWQSAKTKAPPGTVWVDYKEIHESSGLARSQRAEQLMWTHNDSGDEPRLFAFDTAGRVHAVVHVKVAEAVDWEDMCSFSWQGQAYLAIADVGDNAFGRKHVTIYGLREPEVKLLPAEDQAKDPKPEKMKAEVAFEIKVKYPGGPLNCEAMTYDPWRRQLLLASKEQLQTRLFVVPFDPNDHKQECTARPLGVFPVPMATGATISDDGRRLAIGTYGPTCLLHRDVDTPSTEARWVSKTGDDLEWIPAPLRKQGEAICFDKSGQKLLMTSEGHPMPLFVSPLPANAK